MNYTGINEYNKQFFIKGDMTIFFIIESLEEVTDLRTRLIFFQLVQPICPNNENKSLMANFLYVL